ncbi:hypothetical protein [Streptomyces bikiniensis]|uniref:hypothetical protein n=1 Tax=Streptomyces bikiniensis TaxID=1896 RepID=UPI0004C105E5|nr:hypothetical protein [Streptomyces bikiniensis]
MRTAMGGFVRTMAAVAVGAVLVTGCGGGSEGGSKGPAVFGREAAQADLDAAGEAAGLPGGAKPESPEPEGPSGGPATEEARKRKDVADRMAACSAVRAAGDLEPGEAERQFRGVLAALAERGWKEHRPVERTPVGEDGFVLTAQYKKRGWTLFARHTDADVFRMTAITATEDACAARFTDAELELLEG